MAIELHIERGYNAIVATEGAIAKRIGNGTQFAVVVRHHQLVVAFAFAQCKRAVNILQLFGQVKLKLEASDGIHIVHSQGDGHSAVGNAAGVLHMELVDGKGIGNNTDGVGTSDIVAQQSHCLLNRATFHRAVGDIDIASVA